MSTCCAGLSKSWWWLFMLLGLVLLYFLMLSAKQSLIENDLQSRVDQQLSMAGIKKSTFLLEQRGRDVFLSGTVTTEQERHQLITLVKKVKGVRVIVDTLSVPLQQVPRLVMTSKQTKLVLVGIFPSQKQVDELVRNATLVYGEANVDNQLTIGDNVASPTWLNDSKLLLPVFKTIDNVTVTLTKDMPSLSGIVHSEAEKTALHSRVQGLLSMAVTEQLVIKMLPNKDNTGKASRVLAKQRVINDVNENINRTAITACQSQLDQAMLGKSIHFPPNQAIIEKDSIVILDKLVNVVGTCKTALTSSEILIGGYTDNKGNDGYNETLSQLRADAVKRYFKKAGIPHELLKAKGFGETQAIASNDSEEGRAKNRRITFSIASKQLVSK